MARRDSDLLFWAPVAYRDLKTPTRIRDVKATGKHFMLLKAQKIFRFDRQGKPVKGRGHRMEIDCVDQGGDKITVSVFGTTAEWADVSPGFVIAAYGEIKEFRGKLYLSSPERFGREQIGRVAPTYAAIRGKVSRDQIAATVSANLRSWADSAALDLAAEWPDMDEAEARRIFERMHAPASVADGLAALDEARAISAKHALRRGQMMRDGLRSSRQSVIPVDIEASQRTAKGLPPLTGDQKLCMSEIVADLRSGLPMRRLLSGDVGTGKTLTYMIPAVGARSAGARVCVLMPNQLLVDQLAEELGHFFPGVPVGKVTGQETVAKEALEANPILIGTTALVSYAKRRKISADLLICDEQHKLSRQQREALMLPHTNLLEATATAIPRSMALITHGGMDVSILRESPVKKEIVSKVSFDDADLAADVRAVVAGGRQAAVVYSVVEASDREDEQSIMSVVEAASDWEALFPGRVAVVHGQLPDEEKIAALSRMKAGQADVLVASTAIEVGVTIPGLEYLAVVDADRHGVAGLHQLRGRIARKGGKGKFVMCAPGGKASLDEDAIERLERVCRISDGFQLAEADMEARGFGDLADTSKEQAGETGLLFPSLSLKASEIMSYAESMSNQQRKERP